MKPAPRDLLLLLATVAGLLGAALKPGPAAMASDPVPVLAPAVAEHVRSAPLSDQAPYVAHRYLARGCLGDIWLLPLARNGEAADLLPGVQGFVLDGRITPGFPATAYTLARLSAFAGLRDSAPRVHAFVETGSCELATRIGRAAH